MLQNNECLSIVLLVGRFPPCFRYTSRLHGCPIAREKSPNKINAKTSKRQILPLRSFSHVFSQSRKTCAQEIAQETGRPSRALLSPKEMSGVVSQHLEEFSPLKRLFVASIAWRLRWRADL
jgi:hypothetical protein